MPSFEKNQPVTLLFASRKADGSANNTIPPIITISKDGAAGVALAAPTLVVNMALTWKITLTAAQMNCTALGFEHGGAGLEVWGTTIYPEAAYTAARGDNLVKLDYSVFQAADDTVSAVTVYGNSTIAAANAVLQPAGKNAIADALLDRADGIEAGWTPRQVSRVLAAVLAGEAGGADSDNPFFRSLNGLKTRVAAVVDEDGNRISVTYDVS